MNTTSSDVNDLPLWNVTPGRSLTVISSPVALGVNSVSRGMASSRWHPACAPPATHTSDRPARRGSSTTIYAGQACPGSCPPILRGSMRHRASAFPPRRRTRWLTRSRHPQADSSAGPPTSAPPATTEFRMKARRDVPGARNLESRSSGPTLPSVRSCRPKLVQRHTAPREMRARVYALTSRLAQMQSRLVEALPSTGRCWC